MLSLIKRMRGAVRGKSKRAGQRKRNVSRNQVRHSPDFLESRLLLNADGILQNSGGFEPTVAVNPLNPRNVVVSQFNAVWLSNNGGASFSDAIGGDLPPAQAAITMPNYVAGGDPVLTFDSMGRLYFAHLTRRDIGGNGLQLPNDDMGIVVQRIDNPLATTAAGAMLQTAVDVTPGNNIDDKVWIAADANPTSMFRDNVYVVWTRLVNNPTTMREESSIMFSRSVNGGTAGSWSAPVQLNANGEGYVWPPEITVGPNGDVWVAWHTNTWESTGATGGIQMRRSIDGGQTFQAEISPFPAGTAATTTNDAGVVSAVDPATGMPFAQIPDLLSWLQGSMQPRILVDPVRAGHIYVVCVDNPVNNYATGDPSDIVLARSTDNGTNWTRSTISHAPAGTAKSCPRRLSMSRGILPSRGTTRATITRRASARTEFLAAQDDGSLMLDVFATISTDGGVTFLANDFRLNDASFDPEAGAGERFPMSVPNTNVRRIGEYNGLAASNGVVYAVWTGNAFGGTPPNASGQQPRFDTFSMRIVNAIAGLDSNQTLGYTSNEGPALGSVRGALYLAHAGQDGRLYLDFNSATKPNWGPGAIDTNQLTDDIPTMASVDNRLFVSWTGNDDHLNVAEINTTDDGSFTSLAAPEVLGYTSDVGPRIAALNGALYLAHAGQDGKLYLDFRSAGNPNSARKNTWGPGAFDTGQFTSDSPSLFALDNQLFVAWTGTDDHLNVAIINTAADGSILGLTNHDVLGYTSNVGPSLGALTAPLSGACRARWKAVSRLPIGEQADMGAGLLLLPSLPTWRQH